ncbi:MAG: hypothetical protein WD768_12020, partial [Phycisphaeraceae bacterium]
APVFLKPFIHFAEISASILAGGNPLIQSRGDEMFADRPAFFLSQETQGRKSDQWVHVWRMMDIAQGSDSAEHFPCVSHLVMNQSKDAKEGRAGDDSSIRSALLATITFCPVQ